MTQLSPSRTLVFFATVDSRAGLEAAALAADPSNLEIISLFAGRLDPTDGSRPDPRPDAPRVMMHTELASGLGVILDRGTFVAWRLPDAEQRVLDLLATGGRVIEFEDRIDLRSAALPVLEAAGVAATEWLDEAAVALGLPAPAPHALAQVRTALAVLQRVRTHAGLGEHWARTVGDERTILELAARRVHGGRTAYGPWNVKDGRVYEREAMEEAADGFLYSMASILRAARDPLRRRSRIAYLATGLPVDDPTVTAATRRLLSRGILAVHPGPIVAQLVQSGISPTDARTTLVEAADEVCVLGSATHEAVVEAVAMAHAHRRLITVAPIEAQS